MNFQRIFLKAFFKIKEAGCYTGHAHQAVGRQWVGGDKIARPTLYISAKIVIS